MIKKFLFSLLAFTAFNTYAQNWVYDSVYLGPKYRNEVYYSLKDKMVDTVPIRNWHLAFSAVGGKDAMYYAILANHSNDVRVAKYPNSDITGWSTFDTSGWKSWRRFFNSDEKWADGALCRDSSMHPYYSWGVYNSNVPGEIDGDSIFVIYANPNPPAQPWAKKFYVVARKSVSGVKSWTFRYANLDGTGDTTVTLMDNNYPKNHFMYYNLEKDMELKREPDNNKWDLVFTRYFAKQNDPTTPYYQVTGVLHNIQTKSIKIKNQLCDAVSVTDTMDSRFSDKINTIGYDWKTFDFNSNQYVLGDSLTYVVLNSRHELNGSVTYEIYKLKFTGFGGGANGKVAFATQKMLIFNTAVNIIDENKFVYTLSPNPSNGNTQLYVNTEKLSTMQINIYDLSGKLIYNQQTKNNGFNAYNLPTENLGKGLYMVNIQCGNNQQTQKLVIE